MEGLAGSLSPNARDRIGMRLGAAADRVFHVRRDLVDANLHRAFPELDDAARERIARESYRHIGREALSIVALGAAGADEIRARTRVVGWERLKEAVDRGRGVVMATAHMGNWELGGASMAVRGIPTDAVVQRQRNPLVDREIAAVREALGVHQIDRRRAPKQVLRSLRAGRLIGFVADQNAGRHGVFVPFFGTPASTHRGAALFAIRAEAPLFFGVAVRQPDGTYVCHAHPIDEDRGGTLDEAVTRLTAAFTRRLEDEIRAAPEQYFWLHNRWKTRPPADPAGNPVLPAV